MKKLILLLLAALLLVACTPTATVKPFSVSVDELTLTPGEICAVTDLLGFPNDQIEAPSCIHDGYDTVYYYSNMEITASPTDNGEQIVSVTILTDDVTTAEGLAIGDTAARVTELYGEGEEAFSRVTYTRGNTTMLVLFDGDYVLSINISLVS